MCSEARVRDAVCDGGGGKIIAARGIDDRERLCQATNPNERKGSHAGKSFLFRNGAWKQML